MIELATETVKEKPVTKADKIRQFVAEHPFTKPMNIAKKMGVNRQYVYTVMWNMKNKTKAKKSGGMQKKKAMTNKAMPSLPKPNWEQIGLFGSDIPFVNPKLRMESEDGHRMIEMFEPEFDDLVNNPAHYKVGGIETIDFIEAKKLNYNIGNVVKYLTRADHKGNRKQDLEKAKWYLERELSTMS